MATELLAAGVSESQSAEQVLTSGAQAVVFLKGGAGRGLPSNGVIDVQLKTAAAEWVTHFSLAVGNSAVVVSGPCSFRVSRRAINGDALVNAIGADRG